MLATTRKRSVGLGVEALESRWVPAGNVTAQFLPTVSGGDLTVLSVVGDNEANQLRVLEDAPGHVRLEGQAGTTINGQAADELFTSGGFPIVFANVDLGNGSDTFVHEFTGDQHPHRFSIDSGTGNDSVTVLVRGVVGRIIIATGVGSDSVTLDLAASSLVPDSLSIHTGAGADTVLLRADSDGVPPTVFGAPVIFTEQGNDVVQFEGEFFVFASDLYVDLGEGDDTLIGDSEPALDPGSIEVQGGLGHDTVLNASYFFQSMLHSFETIEGA
jgi:hypothetical protein